MTTTEQQKKKMQDFCKAIYRQIRSSWGNGWTLLGNDIKCAVLAERVLLSFTGLDDETKIAPALIHERFQAMKFYCGLEE